jgi:hypothetical protein
MQVKSVVRTLVTFTILATTAAAVAPAGAQAATSCGSPPLSQPFLPWLDPASYALLPNGGFERDTARWQLSDGAEVVAENEPFFVRNTGDASSLHLSAGASATSRPFCVGLGDPTLRFFARNDGSLLSALRVEVLFTDELGLEQSVTLPVLATSSWQPTAPLPLLANLTAPPLVTDGMTEVSLRFSVAGGGDWSVDDVYVDPFKTK